MRIGVVDRRASERQQLLQQVLHRGLVRRFDLQTQVRRIAIRAPDLKLFHLKAALIFDHFVEDFLHQMRVDKVAFRLDDFVVLHQTPV